MTRSIAYLADHPEHLQTVAGWLFEEWGGPPGDTQADFVSRLQGRLNRDRAPLTLVGLKDGQPMATASLKIRELKSHPQFEHWLGAVFVVPEVRGEGLGGWLVEQAVDVASEVGIQQLYLYTRNHEAFYSRLSWEPIERPQVRGRPAVIMIRMLT